MLSSGRREAATRAKLTPPRLLQDGALVVDPSSLPGAAPNTMVHTAERFALAYAIAQESLRLALAHTVGWEDSGGTPRWRCYMQMLPHALVLPLCVACAVASEPSRSLRRRGERCTDVGLGLPERTFAYIFAYALLADFAYALAWPTTLTLTLALTLTPTPTLTPNPHPHLSPYTLTPTRPGRRSSRSWWRCTTRRACSVTPTPSPPRPPPSLQP